VGAAGGPGVTAISLLAVAVVLLPGLVLFWLLRAAGLGIGPAGLLGLALTIVGVGVYPYLLRRLGWVGRRR
jgi:hypothetical protein